MRRPIAAILTAGAIAASAMTISTEAEARRSRAVAAGVIGGLSAGAIIAGSAYPYYGYGYYPGYPVHAYYPGYPAPAYAPAYYGPPPGCVITRQKVWNGRSWGRQRIRVCY